MFFQRFGFKLSSSSLSLFPIMDELDFSAAESDRSVRRQSSDRGKVTKGKFLPKKTKKSQLKKVKTVQTAKPTTKREPKAKAKAMKPKPSHHLRRANELLDGLLEMAENQVDDDDQRRRLRPGRIRLGSDCAGLGSDFVSLKASLGEDVCVKPEPWTQHIQKCFSCFKFNLIFLDINVNILYKNSF